MKWPHVLAICCGFENDAILHVTQSCALERHVKRKSLNLFAEEST